MNGPSIKYILLLILIGNGLAGFSQDVVRNFDFELVDCKGTLISWFPQRVNNNHAVKLDSVSPFSGRKDILIENTNAGIKLANDAGLCNSALLPFAFGGRSNIIIKGYIKTENLSDGVASLWMELKGHQGKRLTGINSDEESPKGNSEWKEYQISLPIQDGTVLILFGCKMTGKGKAWFDNIKVFLDGKELQ